MMDKKRALTWLEDVLARWRYDIRKCPTYKGMVAAATIPHTTEEEAHEICEVWKLGHPWLHYEIWSITTDNKKDRKTRINLRCV